MSGIAQDRRLRVMLLTQHYPPEVTAGSFRIRAFAAGLHERGHHVRVLCPVPNHPTGVVAEGYGRRPVEHRAIEGIDVAYLRILTARRKTMSSRIAYYGSYASMATAVGLAQPSPDVVVASSPPLTVAAAGALVARRHRAPLVLDIRDLWPDSAVDLGELPEGRVAEATGRLERRLYAGAKAIVTANDAFASKIADRSPPSRRIEVVPNGTTEEWLEVGESDVARSAVGLPEDRFVWAYAGNIGLAHGIEHAADAAGLLGDEYLLLVIGEGPRLPALRRHAGAVAPSAVEFRGLMPPGQAASHLRAADAALVSERQEATISAKLYDVCAIGRPVIAACRGELRRLVEREGIALPIEHGDADALAEGVRRLRTDPELCTDLVARAREYAAKHLRSRQADRFAELVESAATVG